MPVWTRTSYAKGPGDGAFLVLCPTSSFRRYGLSAAISAPLTPEKAKVKAKTKVKAKAKHKKRPKVVSHKRPKVTR